MNWKNSFGTNESIMIMQALATVDFPQFLVLKLLPPQVLSPSTSCFPTNFIQTPTPIYRSSHPHLNHPIILLLVLCPLPHSIAKLSYRIHD
jgi:hypothetical protein